MKKLYEETQIQAIADAIREKKQSTDRYRVSAMPDVIRGISTTYHHEADRPDIEPDERGAWTRPDGWPDLDALSLPDDGTNCIYLTVDNSNPRQNANYVRFYHAGNCECFVDYGHVSDGQFVVDSTDRGKGSWTSPAHLFTVDDVTYPVVRLRSAGASIFRQNGTSSMSAANSPNGRAISSVNTDMQQVIEVVGIVPTITSLAGTNGNPAYGGRFCKRILLKSCDNVNALTYAFQYNTLCESLVLSTDQKKMQISGSLTAAFSTCQSLSELDLSMMTIDDVTSLGSLFDYCRSIQRLDITGWNVTSKCTALSSVFRECRLLTFDDMPFATWDTSKVTNMSYMFSTCFGLKEIDLSSWNMQSVVTMASMFTYCRCLETAKMPNTPAPKLTDISSLFSYCTNLTGDLDISHLAPDCLINIANAFNGCSHVEKIDLGDMKVVTNTTSTSYGASAVFNGCYSLKEIVWNMSRCDFTKGASLNSFYANCYNLETPIDWSFFHGLESATSFSPWSNCYKVPSITLSDDIIFPKVNTLTSLFNGCQSLTRIDISMMKFSAPITKMDSMFANCRSAEEIVMPVIDTTSVTTMSSMFSNCYRLKRLPEAMKNISLPKCTTLSTMFADALTIQDIDLSGWTNMKPTAIGTLFQSCANLRRINVAGWNTSNLTGSHSSMFTGNVYEYLNQTGWTVGMTALLPESPALVDWYPPTINISFSINKLYSLSDASLERLIQALPQRTSAATVTMGTPLIKRLSKEQIATITGKGWTIA